MSNERLTQHEFGRFSLHRPLAARIEACRRRLGLEPRELRVLDWGCGRGRAVLWLRNRGYDAVGVDITARRFALGAELFRANGHEPDGCLVELSSDGSAPFGDSSMHFVFSQQTLEHVQDLDAVAREIRRLTMPTGAGFHVFPAYRSFVEPHLYMPLVHWLPKNRLRQAAIAACVAFGVEPSWPGLTSRARKIAVYYGFSIGETFYRPTSRIAASFAAQGFTCEVVDVDSPLRRNKLARGWLGASSPLARRWCETFGPGVGLATWLE